MKGIDVVAELMAISAITAPKAKGEDYVKVKIINKSTDLKKLGKQMVSFGKKLKKGDFDRDGMNVQNSGAVVLIGYKKAAPLGLNCGACGFKTCKALLKQKAVDGEFRGPACAYRMLDMGIALGSAVKTACMLNVDNRIMYRIGVAARNLKWVDWDFVMGIPLSVSSKSIYFDR